jgi:hypothetical protein
MSLELWKQNGWLRAHNTSSEEVDSILALVDRDLSDAAREEVSTDWRFNIAYNAGLQLATVALYVAGYRAGRGQSKHYRVIQALPLVMGERFSGISAYLDNCRRKRNVSEYDTIGTISEKEAADLLRTVLELKVEVLKWLQQGYPELCGHQG